MSRVEMPAMLESPADDEIDLGELLDILLDGKWLILFITVLATAVGVAFATLATPIYKADALIQIERKGGGISALFSEMGEMLSTEGKISDELELIQSRLVLGRTVEQLKLYIDVQPIHPPVIGKGLARLDDARQGRIAPPWRPAAAFSQGQYLRVARFEVPDHNLNRSFRVRLLEEEGRYALLNPRGSIIGRGEVGVPLEIPDAGIRLVINELAGDPGREFRLRRRDPLTAVEWLKSRLSVSSGKKYDSGILSLSLEADNGIEARELLNSIANNYLRQNVERKGKEADQTLEYLNAQLPQLRNRLNEAEARLNLYRTSQGSADLMQETELLLQQSAKLEGLRLELTQQREQLLQRFQPTHPTLQALDAQARGIESNRRQLEGRIRELPETQQELLRLTRDVQVNTALYTNLLNSAQQLQVAKAGNVGTVRIIDYAQQPLNPIKPKKPMILALSVMLGGMLGIFAVFIRRMLFGTVDDPRTIEQQFELPIYATIPLSKGQSAISRLLKKHKPGLHTLQRESQKDLAIEALKSLRTSLHFALHDAPNNILLLTGPRPGVGKTFIAANLADAFASAGKTTVVMDCDMRRGTLHLYTGHKRRPGLSEYLSGKADVHDIVRPHDDNLNFIHTGSIPPNPSELLNSEKLKELLGVLSETFDMVILDSPPNLAVADAGILAQHAGSTVLILEAGTHPQREIGESVKRLRLVGANLRGAVLNKVSKSARRYGYGRYSYNYSYN